MTTQATTYDKKFNAQRGAQRAGFKSGEFEVFKTPEGRFGWRALEKALAEPAEPSIQISDPALAAHPIAQTNAASWPSGPKTGKRRAIVEQAQAGRATGGAGFLEADACTVSRQAREAGGACRSGRCRRPQGRRDQSGFNEPEGDGALSRSGDHRHRGAPQRRVIRAALAQRHSRTQDGPDPSGPSSLVQVRGPPTPSRHSADRMEKVAESWSNPRKDANISTQPAPSSRFTANLRTPKSAYVAQPGCAPLHSPESYKISGLREYRNPA